jgi:hypothetical protein
MRKLILFFTLGFVLQVSASDIDSIYNKVKKKLLKDKKSFNDFNNLQYEYNKEISNDSNISSIVYDSLYIEYYNMGFPIVRLINKEKLDSCFLYLGNTNCNTNIHLIKQTYRQIVKNYHNFNSDKNIGGEDSQKEYFIMYIEGYYILPLSK